MYCLAVSTSSKFLCIALIKNDKVIKEYSRIQQTGHGRLLVPKIAEIISKRGMQLADMDCLAVDIGPGSFTGLRIGIASVKGLSLILKKPVIALSSLDLIAAGIPGSLKMIRCPVIDAKRQNVYAAVYKQDKNGIKRKSKYLLLSPEELLKKIKEPAIISGDALKLYQRRIKEISKVKLSFQKEKFWYPRGLSFAKLSLLLYRQKKMLKPEQLVPLYLYPDTCTVRKKKKKLKN